MRPDFRSALFNLALLLSDAGRPLEAVPFLTRLVHHHPDHVKALILLGDIYINNIEDLQEAERVGSDGWARLLIAVVKLVPTKRQKALGHHIPVRKQHWLKATD